MSYRPTAAASRRGQSSGPAQSGRGTFAVTIGPRRRDRALARRCGHFRTGMVPVRLTITPTRHGQRWARDIEGHAVVSTVIWDPTRRILIERFGSLALVFRAATTSSGTTLALLHGRLHIGPLRVRLPGRLLPRVQVHTRAAAAGQAVRVTVRSHRGRGILTYAGIVS